MTNKNNFSHEKYVSIDDTTAYFKSHDIECDITDSNFSMERDLDDFEAYIQKAHYISNGKKKIISGWNVFTTSESFVVSNIGKLKKFAWKESWGRTFIIMAILSVMIATFFELDRQFGHYFLSAYSGGIYILGAIFLINLVRELSVQMEVVNCRVKILCDDEDSKLFNKRKAYILVNEKFNNSLKVIVKLKHYFKFLQLIKNATNIMKEGNTIKTGITGITGTDKWVSFLTTSIQKNNVARYRLVTESINNIWLASLGWGIAILIIIAITSGVFYLAETFPSFFLLNILAMFLFSGIVVAIFYALITNFVTGKLSNFINQERYCIQVFQKGERKPFVFYSSISRYKALHALVDLNREMQDFDQITYKE